MSPNRVVTILTPLVFAPLAGTIAAWLAEHAPGVDISSDQLTAVFITGALIAFGKSAQWLHGWQKWEEREADATSAADAADARVAAAPAAAEPDGLLEDDQIGDELFDDDLLDDDSLLTDPLLDGDLQTASAN